MLDCLLMLLACLNVALVLVFNAAFFVETFVFVVDRELPVVSYTWPRADFDLKDACLEFVVEPKSIFYKSLIFC